MFCFVERNGILLFCFKPPDQDQHKNDICQCSVYEMNINDIEKKIFTEITTKHFNWNDHSIDVWPSGCSNSAFHSGHESAVEQLYSNNNDDGNCVFFQSRINNKIILRNDQF